MEVALGSVLVGLSVEQRLVDPSGFAGHAFRRGDDISSRCESHVNGLIESVDLTEFGIELAEEADEPILVRDQGLE
ncbi:MAG: hypothetical protein R3B96_16080 [Pirellulaceae bacterium]